MTKIIVRSNQSSVNPAFGGKRVGVEYNDAGNRAAANMYGTIGKAFNAGLDILNKEQEQNEALRVAKATNEFNLELGKLKVDYMQKRQGSNSAGVINDFLKDANVLTERIYAKSGIRYKLGEQAFKRITDNTLATDGVQLYKFQEQETQKYKQNVFDQSADNLINGVIDGESLLENYPIMEGLYKSMFPDLPEEQYKKVEKEMADRYATVLVNDAVSRNNYELAEDRLSYFRKKISPDLRTKLEATLYSEQEYVEDTEIAKQMAKNNISDPEAQDAFINNYVNAKGTIPEGKYTFNPGVSFEGMQESAVQGIKGITGILNQYDIDDVYITSTKNDYSGHAPGSAHYEGRGVDLASDKLAALDESSRNILADRMERAYPGLKVLNEYDDPSDYSTGGHFHLDFTNYKGESRIGASGMSARRMNRIKQMAATMRNDEERRIKEQEDVAFNNALNTVYDMYQQGIPYENALEKIKSMVGLDFQAGNRLKTAANFYYGSNGTKASDVEMSILKSRLAAGTFPDLESLMQTCDKLKLSTDQKYRMQEEYSKYKNGEGMYKHDLNGYIKDGVIGKENSKAKKAMWPGVEILLQSWINEETARRKREPAPYEIIEKGKEFMVKQTLGNVVDKDSWLGWSTEVSYAPATLAMAGIKEIQQANDYYFRVVMKNGEIKVVDPDELKEIVGE